MLLKVPATALVACLMSILVSQDVNGMSFDVVMMKGEPAIKAQGVIVSGDAQRLKKVLTPDAKHSMGYYALVLDSPGGNVDAAFEVVEVMDQNMVFTYVPPGAKCVSACASIIFTAGREHIAVPGGYLGLHGCYGATTKKIDQLCNLDMANHSYDHGTPHGSIMAFTQTIPHDEVVWMNSEEADCWGINHYKISPKPKNHMKCVDDIAKDYIKKYITDQHLKSLD